MRGTGRWQQQQRRRSAMHARKRERERARLIRASKADTGSTRPVHWLPWGDPTWNALTQCLPSLSPSLSLPPLSLSVSLLLALPPLSSSGVTGRAYITAAAPRRAAPRRGKANRIRAAASSDFSRVLLHRLPAAARFNHAARLSSARRGITFDDRVHDLFDCHKCGIFRDATMRGIKRASVIIGYPIFPEPVLDRPERDIAPVTRILAERLVLHEFAYFRTTQNHVATISTLVPMKKIVSRTTGEGEGDCRCDIANGP